MSTPDILDRGGRVRRTGVAALAVAAVAALAAPVSAVEGNKEKTRITIKEIGRAGASGTVSSPRGGCEPDRKVTLFRYDGFVSEKVKITSSNSRGKWRVRKDLAPGKYFAKVDASRSGATRCLYDVSKNERI